VSEVTANNKSDFVQEFAEKCGALNLFQLFMKETDVECKESVLGCFQSFLKGKNFKSKKIFLDECDGLKNLEVLLLANWPLKITLKVLYLTNDLVDSDENISLL
jgi:hypothetical protein